MTEVCNHNVHHNFAKRLKNKKLRSSLLSSVKFEQESYFIIKDFDYEEQNCVDTFGRHTKKRTVWHWDRARNRDGWISSRMICPISWVESWFGLWRQWWESQLRSRYKKKQTKVKAASGCLLFALKSVCSSRTSRAAQLQLASAVPHSLWANTIRIRFAQTLCCAPLVGAAAPVDDLFTF